MTAIWRSTALLALVQTVAACAGGVVRETRRAKSEVPATRAPVSREAAGGAAPAVANHKEKMAVTEFLYLSVYRRGGRHFVSAAMRAPGVDWTETDLVLVEPTVESIAATFRHLEPLIRKLLAEAQRGERQSVLKEYWEQVGATSERQFLRSTSECAINRFPDKVEIFYMVLRPEVGLLASAGPEPDAKLLPDASYEDIARAVLEIFAKYPPPPGDTPTAPKRARKRAAKEQ